MDEIILGCKPEKFILLKADLRDFGEFGGRLLFDKNSFSDNTRSSTPTNEKDNIYNNNPISNNKKNKSTIIFRFNKLHQRTSF